MNAKNLFENPIRTSIEEFKLRAVYGVIVHSFNLQGTTTVCVPLQDQPMGVRLVKALAYVIAVVDVIVKVTGGRVSGFRNAFKKQDPFSLASYRLCSFISTNRTLTTTLRIILKGL